jgi:hypothetical protein
MIGPNGLLFGFNWLIDGPFWFVLVKCLLVTPGALIIIAPILESRWLPLDWRRQFVTFVIGDIALAVFVALLADHIQRVALMPVEWWAHVAVLVACLGVAWFFTHGEMKAAKAGGETAYTPRAVMSPTKLYHNYVLYGGYAYVIVMLVTQMSLQGQFTVLDTWLVWVPFLAWFALLILEAVYTPKHVSVSRAKHAHIDDWRVLRYWRLF